MKRGEIYFIKSNNLETGSEQKADRPAVIVSNDKNNKSSDTVEVVYMTTRPKQDLPTHVYTRSAPLPSTILCEQVHTVSKKRVTEWFGELSEIELQAVDAALIISLGLDFGNLNAEPIEAALTAEEVEQMLEKMKADGPQIIPQEQGERIARLETERDTYKQLYNDMLDRLMKGAAT